MKREYKVSVYIEGRGRVLDEETFEDPFAAEDWGRQHYGDSFYVMTRMGTDDFHFAYSI